MINRMIKKSFSIFLIICFCVFPGLSSKTISLHASDYKTITDMDDNKIEVPVDPKRIACMHGVSAERIIVLGKGDRLALSMKFFPWTYKLYPEIKNIEVVQPPFTGNIERMLRLKVDLVLYSPFPGDVEKYRNAGFKSACGFSSKKRPRTMEDYMEDFKRQFRFFGYLLGPDAKLRAEKYCEYFDLKVKNILAVTSKIKTTARPRVYYGGREGAFLLSQGRASVMHWNTEVAGGYFLPQAIDGNFVEINSERLFSWDPDIILVSGWVDSFANIKKDARWSGLRAVKNGSIYQLPKGVFIWELASGESVLLMIYMAKLFYPDLFRDWDMIKEMKTFYYEVYNKKITNEDARKILNNLPPE